MLSAYFQTQTSIISFHLTSNHLTGLMLWSAQQGKIKLIKKKCCSAADVISVELRSACVYLIPSSLHESSRQSHRIVPVPTEGLLQLSKNVLFKTTTFSGFWAAKKRLIWSVIWGWAKAYVRLRSPGGLDSIRRMSRAHRGDKCPVSSTITSLTC